MSQAGSRKTDEVRPEYDFSGGVRGKHHLAYKAGTNVVLLEDDVAEACPDSPSVNRALRLLMDLAKEAGIVDLPVSPASHSGRHPRL